MRRFAYFAQVRKPQDRAGGDFPGATIRKRVRIARDHLLYQALLQAPLSGKDHRSDAFDGVAPQHTQMKTAALRRCCFGAPLRRSGGRGRDERDEMPGVELRPGTLHPQDQRQRGCGHRFLGADFDRAAGAVQLQVRLAEERQSRTRRIALGAHRQAFGGNAFFRQRGQGGGRQERLALAGLHGETPEVYRGGECANKGEKPSQGRHRLPRHLWGDRTKHSL